MRHVQRLGNRGRSRTIAGSLAVVSGLALFSVARAPLAIGQLATVSVGNSGTGVASTGGNNATGNGSTNSVAGNTTTGGLVDANVGLGAPTNTSTGTATINSGAANASGNESQTGVNQSTSGTGGPTFTPFNPFGGGSGGSNQAATVSNDGVAAATTGGNTATGNNSKNTFGQPDNNGAIDAVVGLGAPTNTSTGTAAITTGPANAVGNTASTGVNQAKVANDGLGSGSGGAGSGAGGGAVPAGFFNATPIFPGTFPGTVNNFGSSFDPCSGRFFPFNPFFNSPSGQAATVNNKGDAVASTGNNTAIGNNSTNTQTINQTASGGLIGLNVNLGSPTNNSTGTATINTGAANASGNQSSTTVNQFCGTLPSGGGSGSGSAPMIRNPITGSPILVPSIATPVVVTPSVQTGTLARTGFESGLALVATALVMAGMALLFTARRRLSPVRAGGVSSKEWDSIVRW